MPTIDELTAALRNADKAGDTAAAQQLADAIRAQQTAPATTTPAKTDNGQNSVFWDVLKSIPSGLREGAEAVVGGIGDARKVAGNVAKWGAEKVGASPDTATALGAFIGAPPMITPMGTMSASLPTTADIHRQTNKVVGESYQPTTLLGTIAKASASFLPSALAPTGEASLGQRMLAAGTSGAASETAGQLFHGTQFEPAARLAGAVAGPGILAAGKRAITPLPISAERKAMADNLTREGVDLSAGQVSGRDSLQKLEGVHGGGGIHRLADRQKGQFTDAIMKRAGGSGLATPDNINAAAGNVGGQLDRLAAGNKIQIDQQFGQDLRDAIHNYHSLVGPNSRSPIVDKTVADIAAQLNNGIDGEVYQSITSRLGRALSRTKDPELKAALGDIRTALNDAMERSIAQNNPGDLGKWQQARDKYRSLLAVENAAAKGGPDRSEGLLSPGDIRSGIASGSNKRAYARGQGPLADIARSGESLMKPFSKEGKTSFVTRATAGGIVGGGVGGAMGGYPGSAMGATIGSTAAAIVPPVAGRVVATKPVQAYLKNQLLPGAIHDKTQMAVIQGLMEQALRRGG